MVDQSGLKFIGWGFGGTTAAVMLIAALLVSEAGASNPGSAEAIAPASVVEMTAQSR